MDRQGGQEGIQFPFTAEGRQSTTAAGEAILAAAVRDLDPGLADAIQSERQWRKRYGPYLVDLVKLAVRRGSAADSIVNKGIEAVHESFRFIRGGESLTPRAAMNRFQEERFFTGIIKGRGERQRQLQIPYRGELLRGDALLGQIERWHQGGVMEPSAAAALVRLAGQDDWLDLRDLHFVLLGANAEVGPFEVLSRLGANVVAVDLGRQSIWKRLLTAARRGAGRMVFPVRESLPDDADDERIAAMAGGDLLTEAPEIRSWLAALGYPFCIGGYAYLHGKDHVRVEVAMDTIMEDLASRSRDVSLAFLLTPTDVFAIPEEAAAEARERFHRNESRHFWRAPIRALSAGRFYAPNARSDVSDPEAHRFGLYDGIVPMQGPNYALAKRIQKWRALSARAAGHRVSANVAPSTATASVLMRKDFAAAFTGAGHYGVEIFEPGTTNAIMAALLIHDLRNDACPANPAAILDHPLVLFMDEAVHGGLWRTDVQLRSVLEIAAVRGFLSGGQRRR